MKTNPTPTIYGNPIDGTPVDHPYGSGTFHDRPAGESNIRERFAQIEAMSDTIGTRLANLEGRLEVILKKEVNAAVGGEQPSAHHSSAMETALSTHYGFLKYLDTRLDEIIRRLDL